MDEYTGFAKWGLLWVLAGVFLWVFLRSMVRAREEPKAPVLSMPEPEPEPGPPTMLIGLVYPGQPIIDHATETLTATFDALKSKADEQARFYIFLTAMVVEAYVGSFRDDLGYESGNLDAFNNSVVHFAQKDFEARFGPWKPEDEDDTAEDFFDAVADQSLDLDGIWFNYAEQRDRGREGAWDRAFDNGLDVDGAAADIIADRIATLRGAE